LLVDDALIYRALFVSKQLIGDLGLLDESLHADLELLNFYFCNSIDNEHFSFLFVSFQYSLN